MLSMMNVRFAVVPQNDPIPDGWRHVVTDHGSRLVENTRVLPRAFVPRSVRIGVSNDVEDMTAATNFADVAWIDVPGVAHDAANGQGSVTIRRRKVGFRIDASMEHDGLVVISEAAWKGWRADVDGHAAKIVRANHAFLGVFVPAGKHTIRLTYRPKAVTTTGAIIATAVGLLCLRSPLRRRDKTTGSRGGRGEAEPGISAVDRRATRAPFSLISYAVIPSSAITFFMSSHTSFFAEGVRSRYAGWYVGITLMPS